MTADQMNYEFEVGYDRITNFDSPGYTNKEKSTFLTQAQEEIILDLLKDEDHYKEDFKKSVSKLKTIVSVPIGDFTTSASNYPNGFIVVVPSTVIRVNNERINIRTTSDHSYPNKEFLDVPVKPVDDDYYHANKKNPYKKPSEDLVWRIDQGTNALKQHVYILPSNCTPTTVYIHGYRKPEPIVIKDASYVVADGAIDGRNWSTYTANGLDSELDPIMHRAIVERAIKLAFAALQDQTGFKLSSVKEEEKK